MKKFIGLPGLMLVACSSSNPPADASTALDPRCEMLAERCDPYEDMPGTGHDCHQLGHANNVAMCVSRMTECLTACPEVPADAGSDAATDASADAATDAASSG